MVKLYRLFFYHFLNTEEKWFVGHPTPFFYFFLFENHGKVDNIMMSIEVFFKKKEKKGTVMLKYIYWEVLICVINFAWSQKEESKKKCLLLFCINVKMCIDGKTESSFFIKLFKCEKLLFVVCLTPFFFKSPAWKLRQSLYYYDVIWWLWFFFYML